MKNIKRILPVFVLLLSLLSGCGAAKVPEVIEKSTIAISKEGVVSAFIVDSFEKDYYDVNGLKAMAQQEADVYNKQFSLSGKVPVVVKDAAKVSTNPDNVVLSYEFDTPATYEAFMESRLYYDTLEVAMKARLLDTIKVYTLKDQQKKELKDLLDGKSYHVVIAKEPVTYYCPEKVVYVSEGLVVEEDGSVNATGAVGTIYIVTK